jgi:hypothetical protein
MAACLGLVMLAGCKRKNDEYCRQAYTEMNQLMSGLQQAMGGGSGSAMPQEPFMTRCRALPEGAAHCMIMSYSQAHQAECAQYRDQLRSTRGQ